MSRPPLGSTLDLLGLHIPWYSLLMMIAVAVGIALAVREERRLRLPKDTILNLSLLAIPLGVVGARLYYVAFTWSRYENNLLEIFRLWNGGLAIYGAVLGGLVAVVIYGRFAKVSVAALVDACAPSVVLAQAIGRWGNYANMEAYGARIYDKAAQFFPLAVEIRLVGANGTEYWYWHMATFFYEFVWNLIVFGVLMAKRKKMKRPGDVCCWYLLLYCAGRTVIEGLRDDSLMLNVAAAQVRFSQILSAVVCLCVLIYFFLRLLRTRKLHLADFLCCALIVSGISCTFVGEFERNAYQGLFVLSQLLLGALLALDIAFFIHYMRRARQMNAPAVFLMIGAALCALTLLLGIGRMGQGNVAYVALRQSVSMLHVALCGAWFYLRQGPVKRRGRRTDRAPAAPALEEAEPEIEQKPEEA